MVNIYFVIYNNCCDLNANVTLETAGLGQSVSI